MARILWLPIVALALPLAASAGTVDDLAWLAGDWELVSGPTRIEEHWTRPDGGTLLGMGRTVKGGKTLFFEYLRIETGLPIIKAEEPLATVVIGAGRLLSNRALLTKLTVS